MIEQTILCGDLIEKEGWKKYEHFGNGFKYHKGFDGNSWYELFFSDKSGDMRIIHHKPLSSYEKQTIKYQHKCYTLETFLTISKLLGL